MTAASIAVSVAGIGVVGPGLVDWPRTAALLRDPSAWHAAATVLPPPPRLPPAERRRSGAIVRLAVAVADEACAAAGVDPRGIATVFSSSSGDPENCHALCEALATPERAVSPTRFTNSVHNAPAGYWHIAVASRAPSTSLAAHDASFGAGLLEAAAQCVADARAVLLVCADVPYPGPLAAWRLPYDAFGVALVLDPRPRAASRGVARLTLRIGAADPGSTGPVAGPCDALHVAVGAAPAGRALPLLDAIARGPGKTTVTLDAAAPHGAAFAVDVEVPG